MAYLTLAIPPGVVRKNTEAQAAGRYYDANLCRWEGSLLAPIGGWVARSSHTVTGVGRAILTWRSNNGNRFIAVGTEQGLFYQSSGGAVFDVTPVGFVAGHADSATGTGYGGGSYGTGPYGVARPDVGVTTEATVWHLDNWGEDLVGLTYDDGTPYQWDLNPVSVAAAVTGAPTQCSALCVTNQRSMMVAGASGNGRNVAWSDLEDNTDWTPTSTNQAGDLDLQTPGIIKRLMRFGDEVLVLTTADAHIVYYAQLPFVYLSRRIGNGCGIISVGALCSVGLSAYWWADSGFWRYAGGEAEPFECDLLNLVNTDLNTSQAAKITSFHNAKTAEVWWFYPSSSSTENDSYIFYNYRYGWWSMGQLARTAGAERNPYKYPILVGTDGKLYEHERGANWDGAAPFAETGLFSLASLAQDASLAQRVLLLRGAISDEATVGQSTMTFALQAFPNSASVELSAVTPTSRGYCDLRGAGRYAKARLTFTAADAEARIGSIQIDAKPGGKR